MASRHKQRRRVCTQDGCGARRFHVGNDGFTYCDQGHQQSELGVAVTVDEGEFTVRGRRVITKNPETGSVASKSTPLDVAKAYQQYLLCLQYVLRKQVQWLTDEHQLSEELETITRDLWALYLHKVQSELVYDFETDTEGHSSRMFSSQSEGESSGGNATASLRSYGTAKKPRTSIGLTDLMSICHIGLLLLKLPVTSADLRAWADSGRIVYYYASKKVPLKMRDRLSGQWQEQLEPQTLLKPAALHRRTHEILEILHDTSGMSPPALNHTLLLYRWTRLLRLPMEVYVAVQRLARVLDIQFSFTVPITPRVDAALRHPEVRLMTLLVIATKLLFSFDNGKHYPATPQDLAALSMDWTVWESVHAIKSSSTKPEELSFDAAFNLTESESLELSDDRLDQYLEWCQSNISSEEVRDRGRAGRDAEFRKALFDMFPAEQERPTPQHEKTTNEEDKLSSAADKALHAVQGALRQKRVIPLGTAEGVPRAGQNYLQYRRADEMVGIERLFYKQAAELADVSLDGMVRAVFAMERKVVAHEDHMKRQESQELT